MICHSAWLLVEIRDEISRVSGLVVAFFGLGSPQIE